MMIFWLMFYWCGLSLYSAVLLGSCWSGDGSLWYFLFGGVFVFRLWFSNGAVLSLYEKDCGTGVIFSSLVRLIGTELLTLLYLLHWFVMLVMLLLRGVCLL